MAVTVSGVKTSDGRMIERFVARCRQALAIGMVFVATGGTALQAQADRDRRLQPINVLKKRALLIGNADYASADTLKNTIADVRALEPVLVDLGFSVQREENLTNTEIETAVRKFARQLSPGDLAWFYYSGHGIQVDGTNYLLPIDYASEMLHSEVPYEAYSANRVLEMMKGQGARVRVLVLDACRNNPYSEDRGMSRGLAAMTPNAKGEIIVFTTGKNDVASDNTEGELGLYMTYFLPELMRDRVELKQAFYQTRINVSEASRRRGKTQRPAQYEDLLGEVILRDGPPESVVQPEPLSRLEPDLSRLSEAGVPSGQPVGVDIPAEAENPREDPEKTQSDLESRFKEMRVEERARREFEEIKDNPTREQLEELLEKYRNEPDAWKTVDLIEEKLEQLEEKVGAEDLMASMRVRPDEVRWPPLLEEAQAALAEAVNSGLIEALVIFLEKYREHESMPGVDELLREADARLEEFPVKARARSQWTRIMWAPDAEVFRAFVHKYEDEPDAAEFVALVRDRIVHWEKVAPITEAMGAVQFVWIPPGTFRMGTITGGNFDERPATNVTISHGFYIATHEVTQGTWMAVMGNNPSEFNGCGFRCPVENVSWNDVQRFIDKLNEMIGYEMYRLPTEAEWEYAARGGSTVDGQVRGLDRIAWHMGNSELQTRPVGLLDKNQFGLHDMLGNVWEWVLDWSGRYDGDAVTDPTGPRNGSYKVYRGGSWRTAAEHCRPGNRSVGFPDDSLGSLGFRLVRNAVVP